MPKRPKDDPKLDSLREAGTLNPRAQSVIDELFAGGEFFDARDLIQVKYEMLRRVETDGQSISEAATAFGFSRPSFYHAQSAFQEGGLEGLVPRKRGPKQPHKVTEKILDFVRKVRDEEDPPPPAAELASRVAKRFGVAVHPRTIERGLARRQKKRQKSK